MPSNNRALTLIANSIFAPLQPSENINEAVKTLRNLFWLPLLAKRALAQSLRLFSRPAGRNDAWASMLENTHPKTIAEERALIMRRDAYRALWHQALKDQGIAFVLTVPHCLPPIPRGKSGDASLMSASYCCLYNMLDYAAGVVPVTFVDKALDNLPDNFTQTEFYGTLSDVARGTWSLYNAEAMDGLPLGIQVIAGRLQEENALHGMKVVRDALRDTGRPFVPKEF